MNIMVYRIIGITNVLDAVLSFLCMWISIRSCMVKSQAVVKNLVKNYMKRLTSKLQTKATGPNIAIDFLRSSNTYLQLYHTNK